MAFFDFFLQELFGIILAVDSSAVLPGPGVANANVFTENEAAIRNIVEAYRRNPPSVPIPTWFVTVGHFTVDAEFQLTGDAMRAPVTFHRVRPRTDGQPSVTADLFALRAYIDDPTRIFDTFQAMERGELDTSMTAAINDALAAQSKISVTAGCLTYLPGFQVYPNG